jgi:hypothetical protein
MQNLTEDAFFNPLAPEKFPVPFEKLRIFSVKMLLLFRYIQYFQQRLGCRLDNRGILVRFLAEVTDVFFFTASRPALGPTPPPVKWLPGPPSSLVKSLIC